jgi:hypothetical protein
MSIATASVSIAPYPVDEPPPGEDVPSILSESDIVDVKPDLVAEVEEVCVKVESVTPEPEEARVMVDAEVTELFNAVFKEPPPVKVVVPKVVRQQRKVSFSEFAKDLPPCCPVMMPSGKATLPAQQHVIAAFFAGALIGCALVMCFSNTEVVAAE